MIPRLPPLCGRWIAAAATITGMVLCGGEAAGDDAATADEIFSLTGIEGGLVVHVGCGDGGLTTELYRGAEFVVHGLDVDPADVTAARAAIAGSGIYGPVSADVFPGDVLPYADHTVNLLVVEEGGASLPADEIARVLAPFGAAVSWNGGTWDVTTQPYPAEMDEWTHYLRGANGNAVSTDQRIGPPKHVRWIADPKFSRSHDEMASLSACVTADGRIFHIVDETPRADVRFEGQWFLVARDAFNGKLLWKTAIPAWANHRRSFRRGPADMPYRLATTGDRVFVTLGLEAPVSELDAVTGNLVRTYAGTEKASQLVCTADRLVVLTDDWVSHAADHPTSYMLTYQRTTDRRSVRVYDTSSGTELWSKEYFKPIHQTMAVHNGKLIYQSYDGTDWSSTVYCDALDTGAQEWAQTYTVSLNNTKEPGWETPVLVAHGDKVLVGGFSTLRVLSAADGSEIWTTPLQRGYNSASDVFVINNRVWSSYVNQRKPGDMGRGRNLETGALEVEFDTSEASSNTALSHHRCYRNKAAGDFILHSRSGIETIDTVTQDIRSHHWVRGTCQYGVIPANGLLYAPPDACACNTQIMLRGFYGLAAAREPKGASAGDVDFETGAAFGSSDTNPAQYVWPTYRAAPDRRGSVDRIMSNTLQLGWKSVIGGQLSSLTADHARAYVASVDEHTLYALDLATGSVAWTYMAGGRIDSPPTVHEGLVIFGSRDGWMCALRASDGTLAWRRRLAPEDVRIMVREQLESKWPVFGSVLVAADGNLVATAGRQTFVDDGVYMFKLDPSTGAIVAQNRIYTPDANGDQPTTGGTNMVGGKNDILVAEGTDVFMRHVKLNFATGSESGTGTHLLVPAGFLEDQFWHRTYWFYGSNFQSNYGNWHKEGNLKPSGRIMSLSSDAIYGYGRDLYPSGHPGQWASGEKYRLYGYDRTAGSYTWSKEIPVTIRAMAALSDKLLVCGVPDIGVPTGGDPQVLTNHDDTLRAFLGEDGSVIWIVANDTGEKLAEYPLASHPVFDGMIVAGDRVLISLKDGGVQCLDIVPDPPVPPSFDFDPVTVPAAIEGVAYAASIAGTVSEPNGDAVTFSKIGGPAWLDVLPDGTIEGTPSIADVGENQFTVQAADVDGADQATLQITVVTGGGFSGVIARYDFQAGITGEDFDQAGSDSVDADPYTTASRLAQTGGVDGGGANTIIQTDKGFEPISESGDPTANWGNAADASPVKFVSFTVTPVPGRAVTYESLSLYHTSHNGTGSFSLRYVAEDGSEVVVADQVAHVDATPKFREIDIPDFTSARAIEWRIYIWGASSNTVGHRFDDIVLSASSWTLRPLHLANGVVDNVGSTDWTTVDLPRSYASMVVVCTPNYGATDLPAVARVRNASGNSFEVKMQNPGGAALSGYRAHYLVIEEGVYEETLNGVKMEALKVTSDETNRASSNWGTGLMEPISPANSYQNPVVLGQVMTANDPGWSVFWAAGSGTEDMPSASAIHAGKHIAQDTDTTRANEILGVIILEEGNGTMDGVRFAAALGPDIVEGVDDAPPWSYSVSGLTGIATTAASIAAMDGPDGAWPLLFGADPVGGTAIQLSCDEDKIADAERNHAAERIAYIAFESEAAALPELTVSDAGVMEDEGSLEFSVSLSFAAPEEVSVSYATLGGTAAAGADYTAASGVLRFSPGTVTQLVAVPVIDDILVEPGETLGLVLYGPVNASIRDSNGTGTIADDDTIAYDAWASSCGLVGGQEGNDDGDGLCNVMEFYLQLDPQDAGDDLTLRLVELTHVDTAVIEISSVCPNAVYTLQRMSTRGPYVWQDIGEFCPDTAEECLECEIPRDSLDGALIRARASVPGL